MTELDRRDLLRLVAALAAGAALPEQHPRAFALALPASGRHQAGVIFTDEGFTLWDLSPPRDILADVRRAAEQMERQQFRVSHVILGRAHREYALKFFGVDLADTQTLRELSAGANFQLCYGG